MNIITTRHMHGPADMRWSAIDDDEYDYDSAIGWGASEQDAIADLLGLLDRADVDDVMLDWTRDDEDPSAWLDMAGRQGG